MHVALLAALYYAAGKLGLLLAIPPGYATAIWPASGIALAIVLLFGYRLWPGILLGSFLVNVGTSFDALSAVPPLKSVALATSIGIGAALQAVIGAFLVRRFVGFPSPLIHGHDVVKFLLLGGPIGCVISSTWGVTSLLIGDFIPGADYPFSWWTWWVGDTIGVLIVTPIVLIWTGRPRKLWRTRRIFVALPLFVTLVVVVVLFVYASGREQARIKLEYEQRAITLAEALENSLDRYLGVLHAIESFFASSNEVTRQEFKQFVKHQLSHYPGIQALSWNPRLLARERAAYEHAAQQDGYRDFQIAERNAQGRLVRASERSEYVAVYYIEPYQGNESALGFDVASDPTRRDALNRARDRGAPAATSQITLLQETGEQAGVLIFLPIYHKQQSHETVAERRQSLQGYITGVFRIGDLVEASLQGLGIEGIEARLYDESAQGENRLLYVYSSGEQKPSDVSLEDMRRTHPEELQRMTPYEIAGRRWVLRLSPTLEYLAAHRSWGAWMVLASGLLLTSLLGAFQLVLTGRGAIDVKRAAELTRINSDLEREVAERMRAEQALFEEKERAQVTLHSIGDAVITTDAQGVVNYLNPIAEALTGWPLDETRGRPLGTVFHIFNEETCERALDPVACCLKEGCLTEVASHTGLMSRSGQEYAIQASAAPIRARDGGVLGAVLVFHDVTQARRMAQQMAHQASHDALTGLVNRREFERRLDHAIASNKEYGTHHALCYLDLDLFKIVNDTAGHVAGDALLKQVTGLLMDELRERDTLARLGGDEFGLLLDNCPLDKALEIAETLVAAVRDFRFVWEGRAFQIGVSIGLVPITFGVDDTVQLLTQADVACYTAKDLGRNRVHVYQSADSEPARRHTEILRVAGLRDALKKDRFRLYYQPIVPLTPGNDGPVHYELLLRFLDTEGGIILPGAFIPAAERYGVMGAIDRWVIQTAFRQYAGVFGGARDAQIAINLSGNSLSDDALLEFVHQQFADAALAPDRVCFEITETAVIHNLSQATRFITEMKKSGCRFALDDFGSGLCSFTYLKKLSVDYLKIDGSFVRNMVEDRTDYAMVAAINEIGHTLPIQTVAEYTESEAILEQLKALGVDYAQGYVLGFPKPLGELLGDEDSTRN